jgi:hypothetical protein
MDHHDEWFSSESVEEQVEWHLYASDQSSANTRMLHDLQRLAQDDARRLAHIKERLVAHGAAHMERQPVPLQRYQHTRTQPQYQQDTRRAKKLGPHFSLG